MMKDVRIEFFHDVLCAWCFAISPRLRKLVNEFPNVEVTHRSFALAPTENSIEKMFGSKEAGKSEILKHWQAANRNDDVHRICTDEMACKPFDYPHSMPGLKACKAAELQGGQPAHWDMFDRIQKAHLTEAKNIADFDVLLECAMDVELDKDHFVKDYHSEKVKQAIDEDSLRARLAGVHAVPTLIVNKEQVITGAQSYHTLKNFVQNLMEIDA
jgi:predicted DsbA family dithiol-disulfide isomerase